MDRFVKVFSKKSKRGTVSRIVREHYLREDISCCFAACTACCKLSVCTLEPGHVLVPDIKFTLAFLELLEHPDLTNIIFLETVISEVRCSLSFSPQIHLFFSLFVVHRFNVQPTREFTIA
jgi:hypothetical protein